MSTYVATVNDTIVARSERTVVIEGSRYFRPDSMVDEHFTRTRMRSICPWKGVANYYTITVDGVIQRNAARTYRLPSPLARNQELPGVRRHRFGHRTVSGRAGTRLRRWWASTRPVDPERSCTARTVAGAAVTWTAPRAENAALRHTPRLLPTAAAQGRR